MTLLPDTSRAWVDIDLGALVANARTVAAVSGSRLLPMVKANGYGLGAVEVARALEAVDPWGYGVGTVEEGAALRAAGIARPILLTTPLVPDWIDGMLAHDLRPAIGDLAALRAWTSRALRPFHVEIDTGMSRCGLRWNDRDALATLSTVLADAPAWEGVMTHFHSADVDPAVTERQWERFQQVLGALPRRPPLVHAANSAAALRGRRYAADMVRPGIFLYGGSAGGHVPVADGDTPAERLGGTDTSGHPASMPEPQPVVALRARVVAVRSVPRGETVSYGGTWCAEQDTTVATLALGYADGFPRTDDEDLPPGRRPPRVVELGGRLVPVVGRVTMDMCMVAVDDGRVAVGDVATIYGGLVSLDRQAAAAGTISYELLTGLGARPLRRYRRPV